MQQFILFKNILQISVLVRGWVIFEVLLHFIGPSWVYAGLCNENQFCMALAVGKSMDPDVCETEVPHPDYVNFCRAISYAKHGKDCGVFAHGAFSNAEALDICLGFTAALTDKSCEQASQYLLTSYRASWNIQEICETVVRSEQGDFSQNCEYLSPLGRNLCQAYRDLLQGLNLQAENFLRSTSSSETPAQSDSPVLSPPSSLSLSIHEFYAVPDTVPSPKVYSSIQEIQNLVLNSFDPNFAHTYEHEQIEKTVNYYGNSKRLIRIHQKDRFYAQISKRVFEDIPLGALDPGYYAYVILASGHIVYGKVLDSWEFGVKHLNLANGKPVLVAGELELHENGDVTYNLISGTYTLAILKKVPKMTENDLQQAVDQVFSPQVQGQLTFTKNYIFKEYPPEEEELDRLCQSELFLALNASFCPVRLETIRFYAGDFPGYFHGSDAEADGLLYRARWGSYLLYPFAPRGLHSYYDLGVVYQDERGDVQIRPLHLNIVNILQIKKILFDLKCRFLIRDPIRTF